MRSTRASRRAALVSTSGALLRPIFGWVAVLLSMLPGCGASGSGSIGDAGSTTAGTGSGGERDGGHAAAGGSGAAIGSGGNAGTGGTGGAGKGGAGSGGGGAPACTNSVAEAWPMFGHDPARTSANAGACVSGPLQTEWRFEAHPDTMALAAIADTDSAYVDWTNAWSTTSVNRVSTAGASLWEYNSTSPTNTNMGYWPAIGLGSVLIENDGLVYIDPASGAKKWSSSVDWWGQLAADAERVYLSQVAHVDGDPIHVGAYGPGGNKIWRNNEFGQCPVDVADSMGGLAVDAGIVYYAPLYNAGVQGSVPFASGVYAFDAASGAGLWFQPTAPSSSLSVGGGKLFLAENGNALVARDQNGGGVIWTAPVETPAEQPPVLADGLAIYASAAGVTAHDASSGSVVWTAPLAADIPKYQFTESDGCKGAITIGAGENTTLAAALGTHTLVVTATDGIHVLRLNDGSEVWAGPVAQAVGFVRNPIVVGNTVYVVDQYPTGAGGGLLALRSP